MSRPTPLFIAVIIGLVLVIVSVWIIATVYNAAMDKQADQLLQSRVTDNRYPKIPDCDDSVELWDCIRYTTGENHEEENSE